MKYPIFYNSKALDILKKYANKRMEYLVKGIIKEPCEIMKEIENEQRRSKNNLY